MPNPQKYINAGHLGFILWQPETNLWHSHIAKLVSTAGIRVASAGFCAIEPDGTVTCFGRSESLRLGPADGDAAGIAAQLGLPTNNGRRPSATGAGHATP